MRVLFSTNQMASHFYALVPLAKALEAVGHEVAVAVAGSAGDWLRAIGFQTFDCGFDRRGVPNRVLYPDMVGLTGTEEARYIETRLFAGLYAHSKALDLLSVLHLWAPDVLVREQFDLGACVAAERWGLPHAVVEVGAYRTPRWRQYGLAEQLDRVRHRFGLPPDPDLAAPSRYLHFSLVPPSFQDPSAPLPPTAHAIRHTSFDQSGDEALPAWVADRADRPTVYATLGTGYNGMTDILSAMIEALRDEPVNLIVTVGRDGDPDRFGPHPSNVHVERYIPQTLLFPYCDLVVSHSGWSTTMGALSQGLPLVCLPISADQPENAARCQALGLGKVIDPDDRTPITIRTAVREVLADPSYRQRARQFQTEVEALPGLEYGVRLLESLAADRQPITT